jgi:hypothetical protein
MWTDVQEGAIHTYRWTHKTKWMVVFRNFTNATKSVILFSACNYTYLQNFIKLRIHCLIKLLRCSVHCCNKKFLITLGKLHFKQYSANSTKCLKHLQYANSQGINCGPNRILLLLMVVCENWYDHFTCWNVTNAVQSARSIALSDELTVVTLVKISSPLVKLSVLSVPAQNASIAPSHWHFAHKCCVTQYVNIHCFLLDVSCSHQ